jgi:hypothetical protein
MAIRILGRRVETDGFFLSLSFAYDRNVPQMTWSSPRDSRVLRGVMAHTSMGLPVVVMPGARDSDADLHQAVRQGRPLNADGSGVAGYDFLVGASGRVVQTNDPGQRATVHGHTGNHRFVGVGMMQTSKGVVQTAQLASAAALIDILTFCLVLPRQTYVSSVNGAPFSGRLEALEQSSGARLAGVIGHRNAWIKGKSGRMGAAKGAGDPGDPLFNELLRNGYEARSVGDDEAVWRERQLRLGIAPAQCDGIVGPATRLALKQRGLPPDMFPARPIDARLVAAGW